MRLAAFEPRSRGRTALGAHLSIDKRDHLVDLRRAYAAYLTDRGFVDTAKAGATRLIPAEMIDLFGVNRARLSAAQTALDYVDEGVKSPTFRARFENEGILIPIETESVRFLPPIRRPGKVICIGANYESHVAEIAASGTLDLPPVQPVFPGLPTVTAFAKFPSTLVGHDEPIPYPSWTHQLDYEVELAMVIGQRCKDVSTDNALDYVAGYSILNDISLRDVQFIEMARHLLLMGKNCNAGAPMGPYLVTSDEVPDPQRLKISLRVNGEIRQEDNTANMLASCAQIVAYWSHVTLEPGDIISTGTPAGVGIFRPEPERYLLQPGDVVEASIERLGTLRNYVTDGRELS